MLRRELELRRETETLRPFREPSPKKHDLEKTIDMSHRTSFRNASLFLATCLTLGCSNGGSLGCGSSTKSPSSDSTGGGGPSLASGLLGVYRVDRYQGSQAGCDQLTDVPERPGYLVLYVFQPNDGGGEARLGGAFCGDARLCRALAEKASEPAVGYSFISGDDASGWQGWGVVGTGPVEDQCGATVQSHVLTSPTGPTIRIKTTTVDAVYAPLVEEDVATCKNRDAITAAKADLPCKSLLVLEATRDGDL